LRCRPVDRLVEEREAMIALPGRELDLDERFVQRVPADPHIPVDTNDYSLDPSMVGRRGAVRGSQREVTLVVLATPQPACRHARSLANHRAITALEPARRPRARRSEPEVLDVEIRPLSVYDALSA